ncbi:MAG: LIC12162 family protein [Litorivicinaceae bacterium]|nr:LIC12162 family protein [Litorivicinaceae bacterium]
MKKRLITTALPYNFNDSVSSCLLLGAWCNTGRNRYDSSSSLLLEYHWNDPIKKEKDFFYLDKLRCDLTILMAKELNKLHDVEFSTRSWQLMFGYWLNQFTSVVYDRWCMVNIALAQDADLVSQSIESDWRQLIPQDTSEASNKFVDDVWNDSVIGYLMESWTTIRVVKDVPIEPFSVGSVFHKTEKIMRRPRIYSAKVLAKNIIRALLRFSTMPGKAYVLASPRLSIWNLLRIRWLLSGVIHYEPVFDKSPRSVFDEGMRNWSLPVHQADGQFENIIKKMVPMWMPMSFLESFRHNMLQVENNEIDPDVVFSANRHCSDDVFKIWAACKIESGCKLVVGQHGGGPFHKYNGSVQFEREIADLYVTLGNGNRGFDHLRDVGQFWERLSYGKWDPSGTALIVTVTCPRYTFDLRSFALSGGMLGYLDDLFSFYSNLNLHVQSESVVRLMPNDYGWKIRDRWLERYPSAKLDNGDAPLKKMAKKARLVISTYNATTYNESLAANIPTIIFWDERQWETAEWAVSDFDMLKSVGIFHETPYSAALHVKEIWGDVAKWWFDPKVQNARENFCRKYAYRHSSVIPKLADVLREANKV